MSLLQSLGGSDLPAAYAGLSSPRLHRVKAAQSPVVRPPSFALQPRIANVRPIISATNIPNIPNQTTTAFTVTGGPFNTWGSIGYQNTASGWGASDPHSTSYSPPWCFEFAADSPVFALQMTTGGTTMDAFCDGELIYGPGPQPSGGSYIKFDWGGVRQARRYLIRGQGGTYVQNFIGNVADSLWAPRSDAAVTMAWMGDSYSQQVGTTSGMETIPMLVANMLGWRVATSAEGGTGYDVPTTVGTTANFQVRASDIVNAAPDVVVLAGGHNTAVATQAAQQPAIQSTINTIKNGLPGVPIVALGVLYQGSAQTSTYAPVNAAIQAACANTGAVYVPTGQLITGTGYAGNLKNDGTADVLIQSDGVHPNGYGVEYLAARIADALTGVF